jgi:hypothetical protein
VLETTIPLYEPDLELLFAEEGNNGDAGHSPLSASWSAVIPKEESLLPHPKYRMTFSNPGHEILN